jgi:hypothetical protein
MKNRLCITLSMFFFVMCSSYAIASDRPTRFEKPEDVVAWLYRDFGWEGFIFRYFKNDILIDQPVSVLKRYFTPKLAVLISKDRKYEKRTKEVGHMDFVLIYGSQDPDGISNIRINKKVGINIVSVLYDYNREKDVMEIDYETVKTKGGWHISDVHYKTRKSNAFPGSEDDFSLLELLSQPYE